jgi:hypothetical protein
MAYGLARDMIRDKKATSEMIEYAISILPQDGYKALGLRTRLQHKLDGHSISWKDM